MQNRNDDPWAGRPRNKIKVNIPSEREQREHEKSKETVIEPGSLLDEMGKAVNKREMYARDNNSQSAYFRKRRYEQSAKGKATRAAYRKRKALEKEQSK